MKKWIYWIGYAIVTCLVFVICLGHILPVKVASMFLLGILWVWRAVSLLFKFNDHYAHKFERKDQLILATMDGCMGAAWAFLSLTPLSEQFTPIILITLPFIIASAVLFRRYRSQ